MIAHAVTSVRLLLAAPVAWAIADETFVAPIVLALMIAAAIASDVLDGVVARATGSASNFGQVFDHGVDFIFVTAGLTAAAAAGVITPWLAPLIAVAFAQYVFDSYVLHKRKSLRMSVLGRYNGIFYFVPLIVIAAARLAPAPELAALLQWLAGMVGYALVASTLVSIIDRALAPGVDAAAPPVGRSNSNA